LGKSRSKAIVAYEYYMALHAILGLKPIDRILRWYVDGKVISNTPTTGAATLIDRATFFQAGAVNDGFRGGVRYHINGAPAFDPYLQANYPIDSTLVPRFDLWAHVVLDDGAGTGPCYIGNREQPREMWAVAERTTSTAPFAAFALLPYTDIDGNTVSDFNPIAMYWELYIKNDPTRFADFATAAQTVHGEGLGVYYYGGGEDRDAFEREISRYANARIFTNRATGLRDIKLIRNDFTPANLTVIGTKDLIGDPDLTVADAAAFFNTFDVTFLDRTKKFEPASFTAYDPAHVAAYGTRRASDVLDYTWITGRAKAVELAQRDVRAATSAGLTGRISLSGLRPDLNEGSEFVLDLPKWNISTLVCRIDSIVQRGPSDNSVEVVFTEDIFGIEVAPIVVDDLPTPAPSVALPADPEIAIEAPYYFLAPRIDIDAELLSDPGFAGLLTAAGRATSVHLGYTIWVDVGAGYVETLTAPFTPAATLAAAITIRTAGTIDVTPMAGLALNDLILVGGEFMRVDAIATGATWTLTVGRGCLDTVPDFHSFGASVISMGRASSDDREYTDGQAINAKYLTFVSSDTLAIGAAAALPVTFASRALRPYPVGDLKVAGDYEPATELSGNVAVTWAHRDRILQTDETYAEDHTDPSIGPEAGVEYFVVRRLIDEVATVQSVSFSDEVAVAPPQALTATVDLADAAFSANAGSETIAMEIGVLTRRDDPAVDNWQTPFVRFETSFAFPRVAPVLSALVLDDVLETISFNSDIECDLYWARHADGTVLTDSEIRNGNGTGFIEGGTWAVEVGANSDAYTFAGGNDGVQEISFVGQVGAGNLSNVLTGGIDIVTPAATGGSFRATNSTTQSVAFGPPTEYEVILGSEVFDGPDAFAGNRFTVPASLNGKYMTFVGNVSMSTFENAQISIELSTDGGSVWDKIGITGNDNVSAMVVSSGPRLLATGDIYRMVYALDSGSGATIANNDYTFFSGYMVEAS
jgi:hypothetical protein